MNRAKQRKAIAYGVSVLPSSSLRKAAYRALLGHRFGRGTKLGWGVVLAVPEFEAGEQVTISRGNSFVGPISVRIGSRVFFGRNNRIECGEAAARSDVAHMGYTRRFEVSDDALVNDGHLFDVLGTISIGRGTWIAGFDSQFLTHGASVMDRDIRIGEECFVGSAVRFAPGATVNDRVIVAMGSVVTRKHSESNVVVGGVPSRVLKERSKDDAYQFSRTW
jgi:acetyltransferase-like isoleucine patch superfamily enzyme